VSNPIDHYLDIVDHSLVLIWQRIIDISQELLLLKEYS